MQPWRVYLVVWEKRKTLYNEALPICQDLKGFTSGFSAQHGKAVSLVVKTGAQKWPSLARGRSLLKCAAEVGNWALALGPYLSCWLVLEG